MINNRKKNINIKNRIPQKILMLLLVKLIILYFHETFSLSKLGIIYRQEEEGNKKKNFTILQIQFKIFI